MNPFNNPQIEVEFLPKSEELSFEKLQTDYRTVLLLSNIIFWSIIGGGILIATYSIGDEIPSIVKTIILVFLLVVVGFSFSSLFLGFRRKAFAIREKDIHYKTGWIWQSQTVIPFKRIQHSEVTQGPIDRMFDLAKIRVFTAGGSSSDLTIPGLRHDHANQIKTLITSKISSSSNFRNAQHEEE